MLSHLLNATCDLYEYTKGATYPHPKTWVLEKTSKCYLSRKNTTEIYDDGSKVVVADYRLRMLPDPDFTAEKRVLLNSNIYDIVGVPEDFDLLGKEQLVLLKLLPKSKAAAMGI